MSNDGAPAGLYELMSAHDIHDVQRALVEYLRLRPPDERDAVLSYLVRYFMGQSI